MNKNATKIFYPANKSPSGMQVAPDAIGHIYWNGHLLCYGSIEKLVEEAKADKHIMRSGVIPGNPMCEACQKAYKESPYFPWSAWIKEEKPNA